MIVGVPKEIYPEERRVAMVPAAIAALIKAGCEVLIEKGAGENAGSPAPDARPRATRLPSRNSRSIGDVAGVFFPGRFGRFW